MKNDMYYQTDTDTSRNKNISFLKLSYGNFVSLDDYVVLEKENQQLKEQLKQKEDIINKAKEYIKPRLNMKNKDGVSFLLFKRSHVEKILEILDNKGE